TGNLPANRERVRGQLQDLAGSAKHERADAGRRITQDERAVEDGRESYADNLFSRLARGDHEPEHECQQYGGCLEREIFRERGGDVTLPAASGTRGRHGASATSAGVC